MACDYLPAPGAAGPMPAAFDSGPFSGSQAIPHAATAAAAAAAAAAGSFGGRGSLLYMPRLSSIPEAAEPTPLAAFAMADDALPTTGAAAAAAAAAARRRKQEQQQAAPPPAPPSPGGGTQFLLDDDDDAASDCSAHSRSASSGCSTSSSANSHDDDDVPAVVQLAPEHPKLMASAWASSIRHFTDCVPLTADSVCSSTACCPLVTPAPGSESAVAAAGDAPLGATASTGSSGRRGAEQQQQHRKQQQQPLKLQDLDASEWQPWDRVARWLDAGAPAAGSAAARADAAAAPAGQTSSTHSSSRSSSRRRHHHDQQQQQQPDAVITATASSAPAAAAAAGPVLQHEEAAAAAAVDDSAPHGDGHGDGFDAPEWWQQSLVARLEEQRTQLHHGSWLDRLRVLTGLAAQRASCALHV